MELNSYIDIAKKATGEKPADTAPSVDHSSQTSVALDMARRQAEQKPVEQKPIPPLGTMPIPN